MNFFRSGMTAVKLSAFNEPMSSLLQIKSEDEADEEELDSNEFRASTSGLSRDTLSKKRYNLDEDNRPPAKKKYRFTE